MGAMDTKPLENALQKKTVEERIEERLDLAEISGTEVSAAVGGVKMENMVQLLEVAKLMAISRVAVPKYLRDNPGACLRIVMQAVEWRMSPFAVADKSFAVNDKIAYESQLIHAIIESRAPLKQRLRFTYEGEGSDRVCIVTGHFKDEVDPCVYRSPPVGQINPKNSPLWKTDPDQQLAYYSARSWARRFAPDVILGIYSEDELEANIGPNNAKDVTPKPDIASRLKGNTKTGFSRQHVERETAKPAVIEGTVGEPAKAEIINEPAKPDAGEAKADEEKAETVKLAEDKL